MKLIIKIDEETYNRAKNDPPILCGMNEGLIYQSNMKEAIANGTPYNPTGDYRECDLLRDECSFCGDKDCICKKGGAE